MESSTHGTLRVMFERYLPLVLLAYSAAVFYKRSFTRDQFWIVLLCVAQALAQSSGHLLVSLATGLCGIVICYRRRASFVESLQNSKVSFGLTMFVFLLDVHYHLGQELLLRHCQLQVTRTQWMFARTVVAGGTQFLRKPTALRVLLQDVRSHLGPIYVMSVAQLTLSANPGGGGGAVFTVLCYVAFVCSVMAGTVFRPDNPATSEIFVKTTSVQRKWYHGRLMLTSSCMTLVVYLRLFVGA